MERLKEKIRREAEILTNETLLLDSFLNHQVEPEFIMEIGREFARKFQDGEITKVVTMESSGISLAFCTAMQLGVPMVFARRRKGLISEEHSYCERVPSFTKGMVTDIIISRKYLKADDRVLFIDDIIANGDTARGVIRIIERSGAVLSGMGVAVEKMFQPGASSIREHGIRLESLVKIASISPNGIEFAE